jgi:arylsulfatase A-like enzyme
MGKRRLPRTLFLLAACIAVLFAGVHLLKRTGRRPNLVLIVIDTLRADHVGCYGYTRLDTPRIDDLASRGVRFENATAHSPLTLPSLSSIMTSRIPPTHGAHYNEGFYLDPSALTLAEILKGEGYSTGAILGAVVLDSISGISQGFDRYEDNFGAFDGYLLHVEIIESDLSYSQRRAGEVTDLGLKMVDKMAGDTPFFLFLHYFDPHSPYDPPPPHDIGDSGITGNPVDAIVRTYDGEIAYTDEQIGRFLDGLEARDRVENTLVVLTSDHGEGLGEHGERSHGYLACEGTMRIPMIFSMPDRLPEGAVRSDLARHVDIVPTTLEILGIEEGHRDRFYGKSLFADGEEADTDFAYFESATTYIVHRWSALRGVRSTSWKYISAPREELYDLGADPREKDNLIDERPRVADSLRKELSAMIAEVEIYQGAGVDGEMSARRERIESADFVERMRALGYIGKSIELDAFYEEMLDPSLPDPKDMMEQRSHSQFVLEATGVAERLVQGGVLRRRDRGPGRVGGDG